VKIAPEPLRLPQIRSQSRKILEKHAFSPLSGNLEFTQISIFESKILIFQVVFFARWIRLALAVIFQFCWVSTDHFRSRCGHFSDFSPVACGDTLNPAVEHEKSNFDRKILGLSF